MHDAHLACLAPENVFNVDISHIFNTTILKAELVVTYWGPDPPTFHHKSEVNLTMGPWLYQWLFLVPVKGGR